MTIPNLITIARLVAVPLIVLLIGQESWGLAFTVFVAAGLSDAVDGFIARRFDMRSEFGAYLDALADKALLVSIYVTLSVTGVLPGWLAILVVSRDIMIISAILVSWLMGRPLAIKPMFVSKLNTGAQIAFAALVLGTKAFIPEAPTLYGGGMVLVAALTIVSAAAYLARWMKHMASDVDGR
jgi:cardiolipin synthase (CMP-forming)